MLLYDLFHDVSAFKHTYRARSVPPVVYINKYQWIITWHLFKTLICVYQKYISNLFFIYYYLFVDFFSLFPAVLRVLYLKLRVYNLRWSTPQILILKPCPHVIINCSTSYSILIFLVRPLRVCQVYNVGHI